MVKKNKDITPDWRRAQITQYARRMMTSCEPCSWGCGAMVCGSQQRETHDAFHQLFNATQQDRERFKNRLELLEQKMTQGQGQLNNAIEKIQENQGKDQEQDAHLSTIDGITGEQTSRLARIDDELVKIKEDVQKLKDKDVPPTP